MKTELSKLLRKKRLKQRLTLYEASKPLDYPLQFFANWERCASRPPPKIWKKLMKTLKISRDDMYRALINDYIDSVNKYL